MGLSVRVGTRTGSFSLLNVGLDADPCGILRVGRNTLLVGFRVVVVVVVVVVVEVVEVVVVVGGGLTSKERN